MAQIIKHRRGTLSQLQGVTLANGEIGIVSSSVSNIGDAVLKTGLVIGNTDGTNRLTFSRLPQGNATPNLSGITGGANFNDMLYHETDAKSLLVLNTGGNTNLDLTGNIANRTIGGTLNINGNFEVTGSIIGTTSINAASFGSTLASQISGSFSTISASLASRITTEETISDFSAAQISGSWQGAIPSGTLTSFSGSVASTGSFGRVQATNIGGTIVTAAQPNITSVGTLASVNIDGGAIDGTPIGANSAAAGNFTTINATGNIETRGDIIARQLIISSSVTNLTQSFSSGSTIFGDTSNDTHKFTGSLQISGGLTVDNGNLNGTLGTGNQPNVTTMTGLTNVTITAASGKSLVTSTGFGGSATIDGFTIGASTAAAGTFTTLTATGNVSSSLTSTGSFGRVESTAFSATNLGGTLLTAAQPNITSVGTLGGLTVNGATVSITDTGGDGTIDGVRVGATTAASGKFTTFEAGSTAIFSGSVVLGNNNLDSITMNGVAAGTDNTVLVLDSNNVVKQDEIDPRVFGSLLVDSNGLGSSNELVTFSDSDTIVGQSNLTFNGSTLGLTGAMNISGNLSGSAASTGSFGHLIFDSGTIDGGSF